MPEPVSDTPQPFITVRPARCLMGGFLMGLANLVPGISGGTMLLASGAYPAFIEAVADISRLKFRPRAIWTLVLIAGAALAAIGLAAGLMVQLVTEQRWIMYSLFIGLTFGGIPILKREIGTPNLQTWTAILISFSGMAAIGWLQTAGWGAGATREHFLLYFVAGILGAAAMILPGISGAYLLLLMGVYVPILEAIRNTIGAARGGQFGEIASPFLHVILPVGLGVLIGVASVSNAMRFCLSQFRQATLGTLMGLLVGAVVGLWPFQQPEKPKPGDLIRGVAATASTVDAVPPGQWPTRPFTPTPAQVLMSLAAIGGGFCLTGLVVKLGGTDRPPGSG